jgi:enoyl-CoA hydratase/carnithine racemase
MRIEIDGHVADVRLNRPEKMNALDLEMFEAIVATAHTLSNTNHVRVAVISGEGRAFCAGIDISTLTEFKSADRRNRIAIRSHGDANIFQQAVLAWRDLPIPVIAAVHGVAYGGGFQLMLGADIRYVEPATKLAVMEIRWGLAPDMAGTVLMRSFARDDIVRELCYTGRIFSGREAQEFGFATRICADPRVEALETARAIASKSPDAVRTIKRLLSSAAHNGRGPQLSDESASQNRLLEGRNHAEALAAAEAKREPVFDDFITIS